MRDLFVFTVVMLLLPMGFRKPFTGLLVFSWLAYMRPQDLCWGFARAMRFSFLSGLVMIVGWFVHEARARKFWRPDARGIAMLLLVVVVTLSIVLSPPIPDVGKRVQGQSYVMRYYFEFLKIIGVALFTTGQVDTKQRLRMLIWTICLCLTFFGVKGGLLGVLTGGNPILRGPGGMLEDNNDFALAMVMNLPLLFYLSKSERDIPLVRQLLPFAMGATMVTILLTHSRGAFLAAVATLMLMAWRSGRLLQASGALVLLAALFFLFAPQHVIDRIASIGQGGKEASANARLVAWTAAANMIQDNPWFGVGMRKFQYNFPKYAPPTAGETSYVAHNSYLQIWSENGTIAFVIYMALLASVFWSCRYVRKLGATQPHKPWIGLYARMMEATTFGFMVGAFFLNRGHFDLIYHWFALVSCLVYVARREVLLGGEEVAESSESGVEVRVRWRPQAVPAKLVPRWGR